MVGATGLFTICFWLIVYGVASGAEGEAAAGALALGVALLPFVFMISAFGSGHDRAGPAVVWAMVLAFAVGATILNLDPAAAIVGAASVGAIVTVREQGVSLYRRTAFAAGGTALMLLIMSVIPILGLAIGPGLPYTAVGLADFTGRRPGD